MFWLNLRNGTGGRFFHNRNDVDEAMREAGAAPALSYLLDSPQNLKIDGRYHTLKSRLRTRRSSASRQGTLLRAEVAHRPCRSHETRDQEALFSQEEIRDLPVDLQTHFQER